MPTPKLSVEQRTTLLQTGATPIELQTYLDSGYTFEETLRFCEVARDTKAEQAAKLMREQATSNARAQSAQRDHEKIDKPHGGHSHYNPAGGAMPKLNVAEFYWLGDPLHSPMATVSAAEIAKLNQLVPGDYDVMKTDETTRIVKVRGQRSPSTGQWERIEVSFPVAGDERQAWPSMLKMCDQMIAQAKAIELVPA